MTAQRILIAMHDFSRGGTERIAIGLAADWAETGRDVTILCGSTEGGLRDDLQRRIARLGLQDRVTWAGHVPDIETHLAQADALLITSRYEGGPAVAVEALAQGVPVVSTDCSFLLHDLITRPEAGCIVTSREPGALAAALTQVCASPHAPEVLQALAAPFEPVTCAHAYLDWLDGLVRHG